MIKPSVWRDAATSAPWPSTAKRRSFGGTYLRSELTTADTD